MPYRCWRRHLRSRHFVLDVTALYEADRKLRTLIHDAIERIEISVRTHLINSLAIPDPLSYRDPRNFRSTFDHQKWLHMAQRRIRRAKKSHAAIRHYEQQYGDFPLWVLAEVLDFSDVSKLYDGMHFSTQRSIAEELGLVIDSAQLSKTQRKKLTSRHPLAPWLEQLTIVRNHAAHHSRVWNQSFIPVPTNHFRTLSGLENLAPDQNESLAGSLLMMGFLLETISPNSSWKSKVVQLIENDFLANPIVTRFYATERLPELTTVLEQWRD